MQPSNSLGPVPKVESLRLINLWFRLSNVIGFILALYAYFVETSKEQDSSYTAMCDISEHMSCSKVFTSKYGRGFGLLHHLVGEDSVLNQPNSIGGIIFFLAFFVMSFQDTVRVTKILVHLSVGSLICCLYLAYILYFVLQDFCVVCVSTYAINAINLTLAVVKLRMLQETDSKASLKVKVN